MNEVIDDPILYDLYMLALNFYRKPNDPFSEGMYRGAVTIALHVVHQEKINEIELKAQMEAEEEKQEEKGAVEGKDKAGKIKKLTAEFIKKHEELNELAEEINELEKE